MSLGLPWRVEYGENAGYDCMTGAFSIWNTDGRLLAVLDLGNYGQKPCTNPSTQTLNDARSIAELIVRLVNED